MWKLAEVPGITKNLISPEYDYHDHSPIEIGLIRAVLAPEKYTSESFFGGIGYTGICSSCSVPLIANATGSGFMVISPYMPCLAAPVAV